LAVFMKSPRNATLQSELRQEWRVGRQVHTEVGAMRVDHRGLYGPVRVIDGVQPVTAVEIQTDIHPDGADEPLREGADLKSRSRHVDALGRSGRAEGRAPSLEPMNPRKAMREKPPTAGCRTRG
jgi:hypothetical protein